MIRSSILEMNEIKQPLELQDNSFDGLALWGLVSTLVGATCRVGTVYHSGTPEFPMSNVVWTSVFCNSSRFINVCFR